MLMKRDLIRIGVAKNPEAASKKLRRWVDYITYDGIVALCVRVLMKRDRIHIDVLDNPEAASEKFPRG